jgi:protein SCO1/2
MNRGAMTKPFALIAALLLPLALSACNNAPAERPPLEGAAIGGPFTLTDENGKSVQWSDFDGSYRIVYFGYTFCPDVCPTDVATIMQGFTRFEKAQPELAKQVQPIFISIDPARDTPAIIKEFTGAFHPRLLGLTGTPKQIEDTAKSFAVFYGKGEETAGGYLMDHSNAAFLFNREGKPIALLPIDQGPQAVEAELAKWLK